jgi:5S rRNA maturation endonuclease (ribonuclease M5)
VDAGLNLWYDHGSGEGGSIVDLGAKLHECSLPIFLDKLADEISPFTGKKFETPIARESAKLEILGVKTLSHLGLIQYLRERGIDLRTAEPYCVEVDFRIRSRSYNAIGFPTRSGSYELRNRWFKGSSSPKDISIVEGRRDKVCVLEGFIDFLSLQQIKSQEMNQFTNESGFIILNSLSLLNRSIPLINDYREINLFLDNDKAGREAKEDLTANGIRFNDASKLYEDFKDVNEFLMKPQGQAQQRRMRFKI